jgi:Asp-tRNA(Asn)/Glu-tRNA(Gln) amidotransferase A subunit family amidase
MSEYDLRSLDLPRLTGATLRAFAGALANPLTRALLIPSLLKQGGFDRFAALRLDEPPTFYPLVRGAAAGESHRVPGTPARPAEPGRACEGPGTSESYHVPGTSAAIFKTVRDYAHAYRAGTTTPEEAARRVLEAIKQSDTADPPLRAFIANDPADVLAQARAATGRIRTGQALSLFDGVPVAIKDEVDQVPYPTTVGTVFLGTRPAAEDATVVARLRAAGALLIGKANMHEIGINPNGCNAHYGPARNPYNPAHDTGGSSSGPAAAVAAGLCPVAIGADGGGSIRIPASLCGLVGLKPTFGRVSEHGAAPLCWSMAHLGPIGATVEDVALAYEVIAGPDLKDPNSQHQPAVTLTDWNRSDLQGLTLGIYHPWFEHAAPAVVAACEAMVAHFAQAGAQVREIVIPELDAMRLAHVLTILSEMAANMANHREQLGRLGPSVRTTLALTHAFTAADYIKAQQMRTRGLALFAAVFQEVDAIITPATAITAPPIPARDAAGGWSDLSADTEVMRYVFPGNLTGLPALSFPVGYDEAGLPIGMQAMGRHWEEAMLLRIAYVAEQHIKRRRPQVFFPILG